jgi:hypothetical protein
MRTQRGPPQSPRMVWHPSFRRAPRAMSGRGTPRVECSPARKPAPEWTPALERLRPDARAPHELEILDLVQPKHRADKRLTCWITHKDDAVAGEEVLESNKVFALGGPRTEVSPRPEPAKNLRSKQARLQCPDTCVCVGRRPVAITSAPWASHRPG